MTDSSVLIASQDFVGIKPVLTDRVFEQFSRYAYQLTGITLPPEKKEMVYGRIYRRLRQLHLATFEDYLELLVVPEAPERDQFCSAISTNHTAFFREPAHFHSLAAELRNPNRPWAKRKRIRIWSSACSSGEEAYSVAMTIAEFQRDNLGWDVSIVGSDIDINVLEVAREGVYRLSSLDSAPANYRERYFMRGTGVNNDKVKVKPDLKRLVGFRRGNLIAPLGQVHFDIILCRNVVIYFDRETREGLFDRMSAIQPVGGLLYIGHSEVIDSATSKYRLIGNTTYERQ